MGVALVSLKTRPCKRRITIEGACLTYRRITETCVSFRVWLLKYKSKELTGFREMAYPIKLSLDAQERNNRPVSCLLGFIQVRLSAYRIFPELFSSRRQDCTP